MPCDKWEAEIRIVFRLMVLFEDASGLLPFGTLQPNTHLPGLVCHVSVFVALRRKTETCIIALFIGFLKDFFACGHLFRHVGVEHYDIVFIPPRSQCLKRSHGSALQSTLDVFARAGVIEHFRNHFLAVDVHDVLPEGVSGIGGFHWREIFQSVVTVCENAVFDVSFHLVVPVFAEIGGQTAVKPTRHIHQVVGGNIGPDRRALHHPVGVNVHDATANHPI